MKRLEFLGFMPARINPADVQGSGLQKIINVDIDKGTTFNMILATIIKQNSDDKSLLLGIEVFRRTMESLTSDSGDRDYDLSETILKEDTPDNFSCFGTFAVVYYEASHELCDKCLSQEGCIGYKYLLNSNSDESNRDQET